ncbi:M20/M25/M40 family metallo-hydrolase [Micromonospora sp. NPDC048830]|uniref:M20/M25/M40 family metallo-hydrolase n=1 Tax=Micromonospora sp. NPDC048830 TaxID=3364257 RepID=UPI0037166611
MTAEPHQPDRDLLAACEKIAPKVLERTFELSEIPAPPLDEVDRIRRVKEWWHADGLTVSEHAVGNLWTRLRPGRVGSGPAIVVAAHLDTVFSRDVRHGLRHEADGRVVGPGCGDDTVAVAALSALDELLPVEIPVPVWVVATVGEEGLGDLAGARAALANPPSEVGTFIALEGNYLGRVNTIGVGSERRRIRLTSQGGHAWEESTAPSAVHAAAAMVHAIEQIQIDHPAKTSRNVGILHGGESINSRAINASFDLDLRSEDPDALAELVTKAEGILNATYDGIEVGIEQLGSRPAGRIDNDHNLAVVAAESLAELGIETRFTAASTDANVAYAAGIPAVTLGITYGDGTHTEDEWIDPDAIGFGLYALVRTLIKRSA